MQSPEHFTTSENSILKDIIGSSLNVELNDLSRLAKWCKDDDPTPSQVQKIQFFKQYLREAVDHPGIVTPELYEKWSDDSSYETQQEVQQRLQEIWDACFG